MNREDLEILAEDDIQDAEFAREETAGTPDTKLRVLSENIAQAYIARSDYIRSRLDS
jgi:hypothetical protein